MSRRFAFVAVGLLCLASLGAAEELPDNDLITGVSQEITVCQVKAAVSTWSDEILSSSGSCTPASECCKICDKGQACGNSCISRNYTCHKGRGCACNSSEVCGSVSQGFSVKRG
jgi:hypothetical protein